MIIYKHILRNIKTNKLRTFLVLLSVSLSAALLFATLGFGATIEELSIAELRQFAGSTDLVVTHKYTEFNTISGICLEDIEGISGVDYHVSQIDYYGIVTPTGSDSFAARIIGAELADFEKSNPIVFTERHESQDGFSGEKIIISQTFAEKNNVKTGDIVEMQLGARANAQMLVVGIAEPVGLFLVEQPEICVIPIDFATEVLDTDGLPNVVYVKSTDNDQIDRLKTDLEIAYPQTVVEYVVNDLQVTSRTNSVTMPFMISSISVFIMGLFIVVTSFELIFHERLPSLGAFRTVGCTRKKMTMINLSEALTLGLLGGILGCVLGVVALNIIGVTYLPSYSGGVAVSLQINSMHLIATILFGIMLTIMGAFLPAIKISKISLRNIILGDINKKKKRTALRNAIVCVLSASLFTISILVPRFIEPSIISFLVSIVCSVLIIVATIFFMTGIIRFTAVLIGRLAGKSVPLWIAMKNVTDNSKLLNILRLIIIAVSFTVYIATLTNSVTRTAIQQNMGTVNYDYLLNLSDARHNELDRLQTVEDVDDAIGIYTIEEQYIPSLNTYLRALYGIESEEYFDYNKTDLDDDTLEAIRGIDNGRNIILTTYLARQLNVDIGDEISLRFDGEDYAYTITGFVNNSLNGGISGFISAGNIMSDGKQSSYSDFFVRAIETSQAMMNTRAEFLGQIIYMETMDIIVQESLNTFLSIFDLSTAYAILATIIGIVGIINNTLASLMERKRELAMLCSVGMSKGQLRSMLLSETVVIAVFGTLLSLAATIGMLSIAPIMMQFLWPEKMVVSYDPAVFGAAMLFILLCMSVIALVSIVRTSKMSIMETLKYE
ncbi:MAG: ABC transporter permease [Lachnospiraceae bacterium]